MKKAVYIFFLLSIFFSIHGKSQQTDFYGALPSSYGIMDTTGKSGMTGIAYPRSAYTESMIKKIKKLKLTKKEELVLLKYSSGQQLTPGETLVMKRALRKKEKLRKLKTKYQMDTLRFATKHSFELSPAEEDILKKAQDSGVVLTPSEKKLLKMVQRHQKNLEKIKKSHTVSEEEKALLEKAKRDTAHLTLKEKAQLLKIKQKQKRIQNIRYRQLAMSGQPIPVKPSLPQRIGMKINILNPRTRPSSYIRKARKLEKKYKLSDKEQMAYNKKISGVPLLTFKEKYLATRAMAKKTKYETKKHKLDQKYFWSLQDKDTRKRHRQRLKQLRKRYFWNNLDKKLRNLEQTLKFLLS